MIEMTLELAERIVEAAHAKSKTFGVPMGVAVVDEAGRVVLSSRADGASFYTFNTSIAKAKTAVAYKRSTKELVDHRDINPHFYDALPSVIPGEVLPTSGGVPIIKDGRVIGGIGIGGGNPEQDHECALAGSLVVTRLP
ncbi:MAG: GlcG/HbpS family heme-binding protein [Gammaproteobacteria bacterium]